MALNKLTEETTEGQSKSKIIILISDGEDFGQETTEVVKDIEDKDVKLFTLGVGTLGGGNIYATNGLKKDRQGKVIVTKLNSSALKDIAKRADGQYFEINDSRNDVSRLISTIGNIEGELRDTRYVDVTANKYFYFLLAAAALLLIDILTNVKTVHI
jgi:Ca-activated chloride channel family protein